MPVPRRDASLQDGRQIQRLSRRGQLEAGFGGADPPAVEIGGIAENRDAEGDVDARAALRSTVARCDRLYFVPKPGDVVERRVEPVARCGAELGQYCTRRPVGSQPQRPIIIATVDGVEHGAKIREVGPAQFAQCSGCDQHTNRMALGSGRGRLHGSCGAQHDECGEEQPYPPPRERHKSQ